MNPRFTRRQKIIAAALIMGYSAAYISRTNIAMMLPDIMADLHLSQARAGLLTTLFAVIYAAGQIVNGLISDRVNSKMWILTGLIGSSLCNLLCSFATGFVPLALFWCGNAAAQSMLWTPITKMLAENFEPEIQPKISFFFSMSLIVGNLGAWAIAGALVSIASWRNAFQCCGAITLAFTLVVGYMLRDIKTSPSAVHSTVHRKHEGGLIKLVFRTGLFLALLGSLFNGFVRDSIMTWAPTILMETQGFELNSVLGIALIIPVVNFFGILLGRRCYMWFRGNARKSISVMMLGCCLFSVTLCAFSGVNIIVCAGLLSCCVALAYGVNPIITSLLPMQYLPLGRVGTVAGLVDAFIYLGSGFSGILTGALAENLGWSWVFLLWGIVALIGAAVMLFSSKPKYVDALYADNE